MRRGPGHLLLAAAVLAMSSLPASAQTQPPPGPLDQVVLSSLGYQDVTLRGRLVSTDYFVPGPGNYLLDEDNWLDLQYRPSNLLSTRSIMTILWNGVPIQDVGLEPSADMVRMTVRLPRERIEPEVNRLQIQAALELNNDDCILDNPARQLTIFGSGTDVRYSYRNREPAAIAVTPDLAQYPAPFFLPNAPQPPGVRLVIPAQPSSADLTAMVRVAAQLGQFAGARGVPLELGRDGNLDPNDLARTNLVFVGRASALPTLGQLADPPSGLQRAPDGTFLDGSGQPIAAGTGVVYEVASRWNPGRAVLVVTGSDDQAVERASTVVSGRAGLRALHGQVALVTDVQTPEPLATGPLPTQLFDLGRSDDTVVGVGEHAISFSIEAASLAGRSGLPFDLIVSHSPLLDAARSSMRVVLNGVPLGSTSFRDLAPSRAQTRVELPAAALRPGPNNLGVEFTLSLPRLDDPCARLPTEQAWAVLHADSSLATGDPPNAVEEVTLASYPYPFVRGGRLDSTVLVVPDDLGDGTALVRLAADLGRNSRAPLLAPRARRAAEFEPSAEGEADVIVWGLPDSNPVLAQLGERLPIQVDESNPGRRLVLSRDLTLAVRDASRLGVVEEVPSPWAANRSVLVVSATGPGELSLAVDALRQGRLTGNAALASRATPTTPAAGRVPTPEPLVLGGPPPQPLQVSTFRLRPRIEAPQVVAAHRPPYVLIAAAALAGATALIALGVAYRAFSPRSRR